MHLHKAEYSISATWGKRSGKKIHVLMSTKKTNMAQCTWGRNASMRCFFSLRFLPHGCTFFFVTTIWSLEWIWQCSGTTVTIAKLSLCVIYTCYIHSHPQYWWQMSEAETSTHMKTTILSITCGSESVSVSVYSVLPSHLSKMPVQCSNLQSTFFHSPCRRHLIFF